MDTEDVKSPPANTPQKVEIPVTVSTPNLVAPSKKHHKGATKKQIMALQLIEQGFSPRQAMIRAGYSKNVANNPKKYLFNSQAITNIVDKFKLQLADEGITTAYLAQKYRELLDAQKPIVDKGIITTHVPDYKIQSDAVKMLKDIYQLTPTQTKEEGQLKRRMTLEEFITGEPYTEPQ